MGGCCKGSDHEKIMSLFLQTLGRTPSSRETAQAMAYMSDSIEAKRAAKAQQEQLVAKLKRIDRQLGDLSKTLTERVLEKRSPDAQASQMQPMAYWNFDDGLRDQIGSLHGEAHGEARLENGALILNGEGSYVSTPPLECNLREKTLEAWVQLDGLKQQGGGVISVQDLSGIHFDAIVYAEQERRRWMPGSDGFTRTRSLQGEAEKEATDRFVHVAMVYEADGTISAYREGKLYGKPYKSDGPFDFRSSATQLLFGNRHGEPDQQRLLRGRIDKAALYDKALSADEIAASASGDPNFVSEADRQSASTDAEREAATQWRAERESAHEQLGAIKGDLAAPSGWADLAHAMFNLKEFLYIR